jgi:hypothetical protein
VVGTVLVDLGVVVVLVALGVVVVDFEPVEVLGFEPHAATPTAAAQTAATTAARRAMVTCMVLLKLRGYR